MKKLLVITLALAMVLSLASCAGEEAAVPPQSSSAGAEAAALQAEAPEGTDYTVSDANFVSKTLGDIAIGFIMRMRPDCI